MMPCFLTIRQNIEDILLFRMSESKLHSAIHNGYVNLINRVCKPLKEETGSY